MTIEKDKIIKIIVLAVPYLIIFYIVNKAVETVSYMEGMPLNEKIGDFGNYFVTLLKISPLPSFQLRCFVFGAGAAGMLYGLLYMKKLDSKKFRKGIEYGSARWGTPTDIKPYVSKEFRNNILLTNTERLTMDSRPSNPKYARNKNVMVIGGSGSGKTRFFVKPNLMQMHSSYVLTDPKGTILVECGKMLKENNYKIKVLNTINFSKSLKYNPISYIKSENDILKLVNTIISNTKGEGEKSSEDFWVKAERLYYSALIGYIWYEVPEREKNFNTLLEMINASETSEDDEEFKNMVDVVFEELEEREPEHFAVRQYKKYKLAAGVISCERLIHQKSVNTDE